MCVARPSVRPVQTFGVFASGSLLVRLPGWESSSEELLVRLPYGLRHLEPLFLTSLDVGVVSINFDGL